MSAADALLSSLAAGKIDAGLVRAVQTYATEAASAPRKKKGYKSDGVAFATVAKLAGAVTRALATPHLDDAVVSSLAAAGNAVIEAVDALRPAGPSLDPEKMTYNFMLKTVERKLFQTALQTAGLLESMLDARSDVSTTQEFHTIAIGAVLNKGACMETAGDATSIAEYVGVTAPRGLLLVRNLASLDQAAGVRQADALYRVLYRLAARAELLPTCGGSVALEARRIALVALADAKYEPKEFADLASKCATRYASLCPPKQKGCVDAALAEFAASTIAIAHGRLVGAQGAPPPGSLSALGRLSESVGGILVHFGMLREAAAAYAPWEQCARKVACEHAAAVSAIAGMALSDGGTARPASQIAVHMSAVATAVASVCSAKPLNPAHIRRAFDGTEPLRRALAKVCASGAVDHGSVVGEDAIAACEKAMGAIAGVSRLAAELAVGTGSSDPLRSEDAGRFLTGAVQSHVLACQITCAVPERKGASGASHLSAASTLLAQWTRGCPPDLWKTLGSAACNLGSDQYSRGLHTEAFDALSVGVYAFEQCAALYRSTAGEAEAVSALQLPRRLSLLASCLLKLQRTAEAKDAIARALRYLLPSEVATPSPLTIALVDQSVRVDSAGETVCLKDTWALVLQGDSMDGALLRLIDVELRALNAHGLDGTPRHRSAIDAVLSLTAAVASHDAKLTDPSGKGGPKRGAKQPQSRSRTQDVAPSTACDPDCGLLVARSSAMVESALVLRKEGSLDEAVAVCDAALALAQRAGCGSEAAACANATAAMYRAMLASDCGHSPLSHLRAALDVFRCLMDTRQTATATDTASAASSQRPSGAAAAMMALADYLDSANMDAACAECLALVRNVSASAEANALQLREAWARLRAGQGDRAIELASALMKLTVTGSPAHVEAAVVCAAASMTTPTDSRKAGPALPRPPAVAAGASRSQLREASRLMHTTSYALHRGCCRCDANGLALAKEAVAVRKALARIDSGAMVKGQPTAASVGTSQWADLADFCRSLALVGRAYEVRGLPRDAAYYFAHGYAIGYATKRPLVAAEFALLLAGVESRRGREADCLKHVEAARQLLTPLCDASDEWPLVGESAVARQRRALAMRECDFLIAFATGSDRLRVVALLKDDASRATPDFAALHRLSRAHSLLGNAPEFRDCSERALLAARTPHERARGLVQLARACHVLPVPSFAPPAHEAAQGIAAAVEVVPGKAPSRGGGRAAPAVAAQQKKGVRATVKSAPASAPVFTSTPLPALSNIESLLNEALGISRLHSLRVVQRQACAALASVFAHDRNAPSAAERVIEGIGCALRGQLADERYSTTAVGADSATADADALASMLSSLSLDANGLPADLAVLLRALDVADELTVVCLSVSDGGGVLVTRLVSPSTGSAIAAVAQSPFGSSVDGSASALRKCVADFLLILDDSQKSMASVSSGAMDGDAKGRWWRERVNLDARVKTLVHDMEESVLGWTKVLLAGKRESASLFVEHAVASVRDAFPAMDGSTAEVIRCVIDSIDALSDEHVAAFIRDFLGVSDTAQAKEVSDLIRKVRASSAIAVPVAPAAAAEAKKAKGGRRGRAAEDADCAPAQPVAAAPAAGELPPPGCGIRRHATVLVLDGSLQCLPWESMPCIRNCAVTRVPSVDFIVRAIALQQQQQQRQQKQQQHEQPPSGKKGKPPNTDANKLAHAHAAAAWPVVRANAPAAYVLNPGGDLKATQDTFEPPFSSTKGWTGIVARRPSEDEMKAMLTANDIFVYCGHGAGDEYVSPDALMRIACRAAAFLVGCSSGRLREAGEYEPTGTPIAYLAAGSPAILANLWDVTDRDIDRFSARVFTDWLGVSCDSATASGVAGGEHVMRKDGAHSQPLSLSRGHHLAASAPDAHPNIPAASAAVRGRACADKITSAASTAAAAALACGSHVTDGDACLARCVAGARDACRLPYLIGAAPVVYGVPVRIRR